MNDPIVFQFISESRRSEIASDIARTLFADRTELAVKAYRHRERTDQWYLPWLAGFALAGALSIASFLFAFTQGSAWHPFWTICIAAAIACAVGTYYKKLSRRRLERLYWTECWRCGEEWAARMQIGGEALLDETAICLRSDGIQFRAEWASVIRLVESSEGILLTLKDGQTLFLPFRLLKSAAEQKRAIEFATRCYATSDLNESTRLRDLLRARDYRCEKCNYNLRGVQECVCPECGSRIDAFVVEASLGRRN